MQDLGNRKAYFISDIHLQRDWGRNGEILLRLFDSILEESEPIVLFLVGDIFDVWVSDHRFFETHFSPFVERLKAIREKPGPNHIFYFEGNHDFHVDRFWRRKYDIPVVRDSETFLIQGLRVRVEHGDFINPEDTAYLKWRATARGPLLTFLAHTIPGRAWQYIGDTWMSNTKRIREKRPLDEEEKVRRMIRAYAKKLGETEEFDLLITGHMHVRDDFEIQTTPHKIRSINLGTWLKSPCALVLQNKSIGFIELS